MKLAGYDVRESDPFLSDRQFRTLQPTVAPIVGGLHALWETFRPVVTAAFPESRDLAHDYAAYMRLVDEIYQSDAYYSLSIEGYRVTPELIERVSSGRWDPDNHAYDRRNRAALAARGYWQAFQTVRGTVAKVIAGGNAGQLARSAALAGYRNHAVFLRGSRHVPPRWKAVRDAMPALFDLLENEAEASVRAVLGHWLFGYVHPYPDGNGRMARFVMNVMLASGGYPWTVIRVEDRNAYLAALESASIDHDMEPFAAFSRNVYSGRRSAGHDATRARTHTTAHRLHED